MPSLPAGTLTLLFSDVEGSTSLLNRLGAAWGEALSAHRRILRESFAAHGGVEMGTEGDSFFVVFTSASEAVAAALQAQRGLLAHEWPGGAPLKARMGLHTGEPQRHEDGYIGVDVHHAVGQRGRRNRMDRLGHQDLSAVPGGHDPRRAVHIDADVPVLVPLRLTGVQAHSRLQRLARGPLVRHQPALCLQSSRHGLTGGREHHEEAVALGPHLHTAVPGERLPQDPAMRRQCRTPCPTQPVQQRRGPLDVAEQQRERPSRQ